MTWHYQICTIFCSLFEDERVNCIKMKTVFALFCLFVTVFGSNTEINLNFKGLLSGLGEQEEPQPEPSDWNEVYYSDVVTKLGFGGVRSYYIQTNESIPVEIGVEYSDSLLSVLTHRATQTVMHDIEIPEEAKVNTPFNYINFGFNPNGHPPPGLYGYREQRVIS